MHLEVGRDQCADRRCTASAAIANRCARRRVRRRAMRRHAGRHELDAIESERVARGRARDVEMTEVDGSNVPPRTPRRIMPTAEVVRSATSRHIASSSAGTPSPVDGRDRERAARSSFFRCCVSRFSRSGSSSASILLAATMRGLSPARPPCRRRAPANSSSSREMTSKSSTGSRSGRRRHVDRRARAPWCARGARGTSCPVRGPGARLRSAPARRRRRSCGRRSGGRRRDWA